jgi:tetratricopeptide (TPR) repeat protein
MAKRKRLNRRVVLFIAVFSAVVLGCLIYLYIDRLPKDAESHKRRAEEARGRNDWIGCFEEYDKAIRAAENTPSSLDYMYRKAELLFERADTDPELVTSEVSLHVSKGMGLLQSILHRKPSYVKAAHLKLNRQWRGVVGPIIYAPRINPRPKSSPQRATILQNFVSDVDRLFKIEQSAELYFRRGLAKTFLAMTDMLTYGESAAEDLRKATEMDGANPQYWQERIRFLRIRGGSTTDIEALFLQAKDKNPQKGWPRLAYAEFLLSEKREEPAEAAIREAMEVEPGNSDGAMALSKFYFGKKEYEKSEEALRIAETIDPTDVNTFRQRSLLALARNDRAASAQFLRDGLRAIDSWSQDAANLRTRDPDRIRALLNYWLADSLLGVYGVAETEDEKTKALAEAKLCLEELIRLDPDEINRYRIAARIAFAEKDWDLALENLEKVKSRQMDALTLRMLVRLYLQKGRVGDAQELVDEALASPIYAGDPYFLLNSARIRMNHGTADDLRLARRQAMKVLDGEPTPAVAEEAKTILNAAEIAQGRTVPQTKEDLTPLARNAIFLRVAALHSHGQSDEAIALLEKVFALNPQDYDALSRLLLILQQTDRNERATELVTEASKRDPDNKNLKRYLDLKAAATPEERFKVEMDFSEQIEDPLNRALQRWTLCLRYHHPEEAGKHLAEAEQIDPKHLTVVRGLVAQAAENQQWERCAELIERVDPMRVEYNFLSGQVSMQRGRVLAEQALRAQGAKREELESSARAFWEGAASDFRAALKKQSHRRDIRFLLAKCLTDLREYAQARDQYDICRQNNPRWLEPVVDLARLAAAVGDFAERDRLVEEAYKLPGGKENPWVREGYLRMIAQKEDGRAEAIRQREQMLEKSPGDLENARHLARLYELDEQMQKAQNLFEYVYNHTAQKIDYSPILAGFYMRTNQSTRADALFKGLLKSAEDPADKVAIFVHWGQALAPVSLLEALKYVQKAIETQKTNPRGYAAMRELLNTQAEDLTRERNFEDAAIKKDEALAMQQRVVDLSPNNPKERLLLYGMLTEAGKFDSAIAGFQEILDEKPDDVNAIAGLARVHMEMGDLDKACEMLDRAIALNPDLPVPYQRRATLYLARAEFGQAIRDLERSLALADDVSARLALAQLCVYAGNDSRAVELYNRILVDHPRTVAAYTGLVSLYTRREQWPLVESCARKGAELFPRQPFFPSALADMYERLGQPEKKIEFLKKALDLMPDHPRLVYSYLRALSESDRQELFRTEIEKYLAQPKHRLRALTLDAYAAAQKDPDSEESFQKFLTALRETQTPGAAIDVANHLRRALGSKTLCERRADIVAIRPGDWGLKALVGDSYMQNGNYDEAETWYIQARKAATGGGDKMAVTQRLAYAYERQGKTEDAVTAYQAILRTNPNNVEALNNFAYLLTDRLGKGEEALPMAERAVRGRPGDLNVLDTYAWTLTSLGQLDKARALFENIMARGHENAEVLYHLAALNEKENQPDEARKFYRRGWEYVKDEKNHPLYEALKKGAQP